MTTAVPAWQPGGSVGSARSFLRSYLVLPDWGFPILGVGWTLEYEMIFYLIVALALTGQETQARDGFERYLSVPGTLATMAALNRVKAQYVNEHTDPRYVEYWDRLIEGLRKAGLREE